MKKILLCWIISLSYLTFLQGQDTLYLNPQNSSDPARNGSKEHPYISLEEITLQNNTVYLFKRGTTMGIGNLIFQSINGITFGAYEQGTLPRINSSSIQIRGCNEFTIEDIEIYSEGSNCLRFHHEYTNENIVVRNCIFHGGNWELNGDQVALTGRMTHMYVENTEIYNIYRDGIYLVDSHDITFNGCYIHNVNKIYNDNVDDANGDAIQVLGTTQLTIQNCFLDRSDSGKKFGLILNENSDDAIIEDNVFIGPKKTVNGGANLYLTGSGHTVRRNVFRDAPNGIYSHATDPLIHHNQFIAHNQGIYIASNSGLLYNNTFYNNDIGIYTWLGGSIIKNNVVYLTSESQEAFHVADVTLTNNLQNRTGENAKEDVIIENPKFMDVENLDFRLTSTSPCIDAGTDVGLTHDFNNQPVPCNSLPDIGAFEDQTGCTPSENHRPVADAGTDIEALAGDKVELDGSASYDEDNDSLYFTWNSENPIKLQKATSINPYFIAPDVEQRSSYKIQLQVSDGFTKSEPDALIASISPLANAVIPISSNNSHFSLYPNPAKQYITLRNNQINVSAPIKIQLITLRGEKKLELILKKAWYFNQLINIPLGQLPTGIYLIILRTPEKIIWEERFIKVSE
ncbi:MAG: right-handed parallel beta-helix repeat-containing protein [Bacteroidales bacterium]